MRDPFFEILNRGGTILAANIASHIYENDEADRAVLTSILSSVFHAANNMVYPELRRQIIDRINRELLPRLGPERTTALYGEVETQINRVARRHGLETERGWLTAASSQEGIYEDYFRRERNTYEVGAHGDAINVVAPRNRPGESFYNLQCLAEEYEVDHWTHTNGISSTSGVVAMPSQVHEEYLLVRLWMMYRMQLMSIVGAIHLKILLK